MNKATTPDQQSLRGLPYVAIDPQWLLESEAFHSPEPRLVRAVTQMLFAAWSNCPAASIPADYRSIGRLCGLTDIEVGEHYDVLTAGWELRSGRLFHIGMAALAERLLERHGEALREVCDRSAAVVQDPELFELTAPQPTAKPASRLRGKRMLPKDFVLTEAHRAAMAEKAQIVDPRDHQFVFDKFVSRAQAEAVMQANWDSALVNFAMKENRRLLPSQQSVPLVAHGSARVRRYGEAGQAATAHNLSAVDSLIDRARGRAAQNPCPAGGVA